VDRTVQRTPAVGQASGTGWAIAAVLGSLFGWTSIPLFLKHFTSHIDAWTANGWRYGISALLWAPVILLGLRRRTLPRGLWAAAAIPALFNTAAQVCFALAPYYMDPGLMTFSLRFQIVFVTVMAAVLFVPERRVIASPLFLFGVLLVIVGTLLTIALKPEGLGSGTALGVTLAVASGLLYGAYALSVRRSMSGINPITAFAAVSLYTAAALVILMLAFAKPVHGSGPDFGASALTLPAVEWFNLVLSAVVGIGLGHTFYFFSISRLGVAVSAGVVQLQPITVSIGSYFLFGERLTAVQWVTGLAAIAGAVLMLVAQHRARRLDPSGRPVPPLDQFEDLPVDPDVALADQSNEPPPPDSPPR
jgi:drug/metabolite transporter (DMT)-like permease